MSATWCGIVGLRPLSELFELDGVVSRSRALDVVGHIVRTVENCEYFLSTSFLPKSIRNIEHDGLCPIQIGWDPRLLQGVDDEVAEAFRRFIQEMQKQPNISFVKQFWPDFLKATNCDLTVLQMEFLQDFKILILLFSLQLHLLPVQDYRPIGEGFWPWLQHLILPSIALGTVYRRSHCAYHAC